MIRINLLPFRAARTKENVRRQVTIFLLLVVLIIVALGGYSLQVKTQVGGELERVSQIQAELNKYKKQAREVDAINKKNKMLQKKIDIIEELQVVRKAPVKVLGALTELVTPERMWITSYREAGDKITLIGFALDEITIADFTRKLSASPYFEGTTLKYVRHAVQRQLPMKSFEISCTRARIKQTPSNATGMKVK